MLCLCLLTRIVYINVQLTRWPSGISPDFGASAPGFETRLCLLFCFVVVVILLLSNCVICRIFWHSFCNVNSFHIIYCKVCDQLNGYKDTDLASLILFERTAYHKQEVCLFVCVFIRSHSNCSSNILNIGWLLLKMINIDGQKCQFTDRSFRILTVLICRTSL